MKPARRVTIGYIAMAVTITAALAMASHRGARLKADTTYGAARHSPLTRESLTGSFDAGIRNVVVQWDPRDPRSPDARRAALMAFVYETYDASAWIPQSLFDSNFITQAVAGDIETIVSERAGLVRWRDNPLVPAFGMAPNADSGSPLRWTVNCLTCHMAEIDGVAYFGAGTKTFDDVWLGEALKRLTNEPWRGRLRGTRDYDVAQQANRILNSHHHDKIDSLTRGRSTAFAASHVEFFMRQHGGQMPGVAEVGRGDVKTPPLWHAAAKLTAGRWYTDGSFHGRLPLMATSMELEKDRPFDALVSVVVPRIKDEFDTVITRLRPPPYPYAIDRALADRGRRLFESRELDARAVTARATDAATSTGLTRIVTSGPMAPDSTSSRTGSSTRSTTARWWRRGRSAGVTAMRPRHRTRLLAIRREEREPPCADRVPEDALKRGPTEGGHYVRSVGSGFSRT